MFFLLVSYQSFGDLASLIRPFALLQAILGGTIQVPTLSGDVVVKVYYMQLIKPITFYKVSVTSIFDIIYSSSDFSHINSVQVRPGTQPGQKVVLRKKGKRIP